MRLELQQIPPAPRQPRWPPVLWSRWPLALLAFLLTVYGGTVTLMFFYVWGGAPSDDARLDAGGQRVPAEVVQVIPIASTPPRWLVYFRFQPTPRTTAEGEAYVDAEPPRGAPLEVEFLPGEEHVSRIVGTHRSRLAALSAPIWQSLWRWMMLPGLGALLLWWLGVLRTRNLLIRGDVAVAALDRVTPVALVVPGMLHVAFSFRDRRARVQHGWHWVRARSRLGLKLQAAPAQAPVVHDRDRPWICRVVTGDDFVGSTDDSEPRLPDFTPRHEL